MAVQMEFVLEYIKKNRGKVTGALLGLAFGLLTAILGFWRALFIGICVAVGYYLGLRLDRRQGFEDLIDRLLRWR